MNRIRLLVRPKVMNGVVYPTEKVEVLQEAVFVYKTPEGEDVYEWRDVPIVFESEP